MYRKNKITAGTLLPAVTVANIDDVVKNSVFGVVVFFMALDIPYICLRAIKKHLTVYTYVLT